MRLFVCITLIFWILLPEVRAQELTGAGTQADSVNLVVSRLQDGQQPGKVRVIQDPRLTNILRKHYEFNRTSGSAQFRIVLYKGRDMTKANEARAEYENSFGHLKLPVEIQYNEPDFTTLVGAFRTREDAFRYRKELIARFPQAYVPPAKILLR